MPAATRSGADGASLVATAPVPVRERPRDDAPLVTELVTGERLEVVGARDGWLRVVVPGHANHLDPRGYPGWAHPEGLAEVPGWHPDLTVVSENRSGLPLGALLGGYENGARRPDGSPVEVESGALLPVGVPVGATAGDLARTLLGLPYRWGGTDSTAGMDCSGLVFRVMQLSGVTVPRDADDQFARAPFPSREGWREAETNDLVFFGENSVTHVGIYLGDGAYVSAHGSAHGSGGVTVRGVEEDPYWGFARYPRTG